MEGPGQLQRKKLLDQAAQISVADSLRTWEMVDKVLDIHSVADAKGMRGALSGQPNAKNG